MTETNVFKAAPERGGNAVNNNETNLTRYERIKLS